MNHNQHQMQLTSLLQYFPGYNEQQFNQKFRQKVKRGIIELLQKHQNLTDREMASILGFNDPNKVRPRRHELSNPERYFRKINNQFVWVLPWKNHPMIVEAEKRNCNVTGKLSIAWKISEENLNAYLKP